jgi:uncharacterized membrane protein
VYSSRAAGAVAAVLVGSVTIFSSYAFGGLLMAFFVSSSLLTRIAGNVKARAAGRAAHVPCAACVALQHALLCTTCRHARAALSIGAACTGPLRAVQAKLDVDHKLDGQRNWAQVAANGAVPTVLAVLFGLTTGWSHVPFLHGCAAHAQGRRLSSACPACGRRCAASRMRLMR